MQYCEHEFRRRSLGYICSRCRSADFREYVRISPIGRSMYDSQRLLNAVRGAETPAHRLGYTRQPPSMFPALLTRGELHGGPYFITCILLQYILFNVVIDWIVSRHLCFLKYSFCPLEIVGFYLAFRYLFSSLASYFCLFRRTFC